MIKSTVVHTVPELIAAIGGTSVASAKFGLGMSAISNWKRAGMIPDRMHRRVQQVAKEEGITVPDTLFGQPFTRPRKQVETAA